MSKKRVVKFLQIILHQIKYTKLKKESHLINIARKLNKRKVFLYMVSVIATPFQPLLIAISIEMLRLHLLRG